MPNLEQIIRPFVVSPIFGPTPYVTELNDPSPGPVIKNIGLGGTEPGNPTVVTLPNGSPNSTGGSGTPKQPAEPAPPKPPSDPTKPPKAEPPKDPTKPTPPKPQQPRKIAWKQMTSTYSIKTTWYMHQITNEIKADTPGGYPYWLADETQPDSGVQPGLSSPSG